MGTVLYEQSSKAVSTSGDSGPLEVGPLTTLAADVNCTAVAGGGTATVFVDRLGADGVWYPIWSPTAISGAGNTSTSIGPGCATAAVVTSTIRFRWVISGTSVTFSVSLIAR